jgi:hypothetical protein
VIVNPIPEDFGSIFLWDLGVSPTQYTILPLRILQNFDVSVQTAASTQVTSLQTDFSSCSLLLEVMLIL